MKTVYSDIHKEAAKLQEGQFVYSYHEWINCTDHYCCRIGNIKEDLGNIEAAHRQIPRGAFYALEDGKLYTFHKEVVDPWWRNI